MRVFAEDYVPLKHFQDSILKYYVQRGFKKSQLNIGVPLYGQTFQLSNPALHGMSAASLGPGMAGEFTNQPGMLSYMEICKKGEFKF